MAGHSFSSQSPDSQVALPRAQRGGGCQLRSPPSPRAQPAGGTSPGLGLVHSEGEVCPEFSFAPSGPLQDAALAMISQCRSLEMPTPGFYCRRTFSSSAWSFYSFLPLLPKRPELLPQRALFIMVPLSVSLAFMWQWRSLCLIAVGAAILASGLNPGALAVAWRSLWASCNSWTCSVGPQSFSAPELMKQLVRRKRQADSKLEFHSMRIIETTYETAFAHPR